MTPQNESSELHDLELLVRYAQGDCSADERNRIDAAMVANHALARRIAAMQAAQWDGARKLDQVWTVIRHAEADEQPVARARTPVRQQTVRGVFNAPSRSVEWSGAHWSARSVMIGIAAVVLCAIGLMTTLMYRSGSEIPAIHYQTATGQVSRVVLPDGTTMTLAPATSVAVSGTKGGAAVDVVGEAYFAVAPSSTHPFVIRTSNTVVQVLGTAFSVRRYASETRTQVVVEDGKVAVRAKRHGTVNDVPMTMTARMVAQVSDSGVSVTPISDTRTLTGWRDGMLVFSDAPVRDVVAEIARCYGVVIRIEGNDLANERLGLEVAVRRYSLSQVLNMVSLATHAHVRRDGDAFVLVPGRGMASPRERKQQSPSQPEKLYGR